MIPNLNPNSDAENLQIFLQPYFATLSYKSLQKSYPQVLYLFGNLSWSPTWIPTQMWKFCKFFCNPILQTHIMEIFLSLTPKCYTFLETFYDTLQQFPRVLTQLQKFCKKSSL